MRLHKLTTLAFASLLAVALLSACGGQRAQMPATSVEVDSLAPLYPDYTDVTVPANIAPLNCMLEHTDATDMVMVFKGEQGEELITGGEGLKVRIDTTAWRTLLQTNRGKEITVTVYAETAKGWKRYRPHHISVAQEEIDAFLTYRLIEPGYELYRQLGIYQRNLTNWDVETVYENNRVFEDGDNHCINCHNFQNHSTENMLFHVRANHGGTIIVQGGKAEKVQIKGDSILTAGVYPSWHPKAPLVAFSTNKTGQSFHLHHPEALEVLDERSDLLLYDVEKHQIQMVLTDTTLLETFPCWSPDGQWLYYCVTREPDDKSFPDSLHAMMMLKHYQELRYDVYRLPFDVQTRRFGPSELVIDCASRQRSATFPRISPDGRYLLFAEGDYGQFHIWHKSSDLYVKDLQTGSLYALTEANSDDVDSYHSWSSNGRWIVFSSRRMDGAYTRTHIAYFDPQGRARKAFCLPQEDPEYNIMLLKSYNVPELTKDAVRTTPQTLKETIYNEE